MKKKSEKAKLRDKIHGVMKEIRFHAYGEKCVICGSTNVVQLGHVIPAGSSLSVRFDLDNTYPQCRACNGKHRYNQSEYINWYVKTFGQENFDYLVQRSKQLKKYNTGQLREKLKEMEELRDEIVNK